MKKIAILGTKGYPYIYGGYETFVKEVAERLAGKYKIYVYCHRRLFKKRPKVVHGINLFYIPAIERKSLSQFSHSFFSTIHALFCRYDVILYVNPANGPFGYIMKWFSKKSAINTDGLEWLRPKWKGLGAKYFYWASKIATQTFDVLISDSFRMAEIYEKEFNASSEIIAYGANVKYSDGDFEITEMGFKKDDYYLIVGRLIPDNNADMIVKGFLKSNTSKKLIIVGDTPFEDEYSKSIKKFSSDQVIFTGYVIDQHLLKELYANAYCYFHGHEFGGTNPALLKALAYGCCILTIDTVFSREVLLDEEHGLYFKKNTESVTELINSIDFDPALVQSYRVKSRDRIKDNYTWGKISQQYDDLFQQMLIK